MGVVKSGSALSPPDFYPFRHALSLLTPDVLTPPYVGLFRWKVVDKIFRTEAKRAASGIVRKTTRTVKPQTLQRLYRYTQ